ncbi:hypothetical protein OC846_004871 [Tilletia horrida]|uniref:Uncharacterized protein n=1 Tax=Tilletia horrida TaxID=155126 RepID=A0AAN6GLU4_9BASI|nr:hypothetical protein OC846_004871 [Tilletia horrida]KAK0562758.1 hypothetical protein OC861_005158 [Tilletia horrida]
MDPASRVLYRRLLRAARASVKFHRPAAANLRRALRDDFVAAYGQSFPNPLAASKSAESARKTIALLLSSAISPRRDPQDTSHMAATKVRLQDEEYDPSRPLEWNPAPSKAVIDGQPELRHTLANEIVKNLASLTYHHLSPHTQMANSPPSSKTRKAPKLTSGRGSRQASASGSASAISANSIALDELGGSNSSRLSFSDEGSPFSSEFLVPSLRVPAKPGRGPIHSKSKSWDGQNPSSVLALGQNYIAGQTDASSAKTTETLASLQARLEVLAEQYTTARQKEDEGPHTAIAKQAKSTAVPSDQILRQMREVRGVIKSTRQRLETAERIRAVTSLPQEWLSDLVGNIETSEGVWIGGTRMNKWVKGQWLSP